MNDFTMEWQESIKLNAITSHWIAKLVIWSVIVAYLPNIVWYFIGYPANALFMQTLVMTVGMPLIIILSMRVYRRQKSPIPLKARLWMDNSSLVVSKTIMAHTFRRYIEVRKIGKPSIETITLNKATKKVSITGLWHIEVYTRGFNGARGNLIASELLSDTVEINESTELKEFIRKYYNDIINETSTEKE